MGTTTTQDPKRKNSVFRSVPLELKKSHQSLPGENTVPLIDQTFPLEIFWANVILCVVIHVAALYGLYLGVTVVMYRTWLWNIFFNIFSSIGTAAGAHRYWSHKAFKARLPLRLLLVTLQTFSFQYSAYDWARTHRVHHKYSETNADPHSIKRGFFFAHIGWLLCREHPAVTQKIKEVDTSDLEADGIVMFQKKYYWQLVLFCICLMPLVPIYVLGETVEVAIFFSTILIFIFGLHVTGFINSVAHVWGDRPYEKKFGATDNAFLLFLTGGEGCHNYHHAFPWDYKTGEIGHNRYVITAFLEFMARIGWAYELKTVSKEMAIARAARTGDGSHYSVAKKTDAKSAWEGDHQKLSRTLLM